MHLGQKIDFSTFRSTLAALLRTALGLPKSYNVTFNDLSSNPVTVEQLRSQVPQLGLDHFGEIVGLGGESYREMIETVLGPTGAALSSPFTRLSIGKLLQALDRVLSNSTDAAAPLDQVPATSSSRLKGGPRSRDIMLEAEHAKRTLRVDRTEGEKEFAQLLEQYPQDGMVYLLGAKRGWKLVTYVVPTQTCCAPRSYCMAKRLNS